jgi:hypothetical protein
LVCQIWQFDTIFPGIVKSSDDVAKVAVKFEGRTYGGRVVSSHPEGRAKKHCRFYFDEALARRLKEVFLMSHMRDLESRLNRLRWLRASAQLYAAGGGGGGLGGLGGGGFGGPDID